MLALETLVGSTFWIPTSNPTEMSRLGSGVQKSEPAMVCSSQNGHEPKGWRVVGAAVVNNSVGSMVDGRWSMVDGQGRQIRNRMSYKSLSRVRV